MNSNTHPHYTVVFRFCPRCGGRLVQRELAAHDPARAFCCDCNVVHYQGPSLLVLSLVFFKNSLLLIRRGQQPYKNKWAVPGGFVEAGESLEFAAIREAEEETGLCLTPKQLYPFGLLSLPEMNQVYALFFARIVQEQHLSPRPPETLEVGWFTQDEMPLDDLWEPASTFDLPLFFERAAAGNFDFYQRSDDFMRMISEWRQERVIWLKNPQN